MTDRLRHELTGILQKILGRSRGVTDIAESIMSGEEDAPYELIFKYLTGTEVSRPDAKSYWEQMTLKFAELEKLFGEQAHLVQAAVDLSRRSIDPYPVSGDVEIETLRRAADTDPLTALHNRASYAVRLEETLRSSSEAGEKVSLVVFDLDHFKGYNDTFGHDAGDHVLQHWAAILKKGCRATDTPARYGGEEFVLVLKKAGAADAVKVAQRLAGALKSQPLKRKVTVSAGVATYPDDTMDSEELFNLADKALYEAKMSGRDRVRRYRKNIGPFEMIFQFILRRAALKVWSQKWLYGTILALVLAIAGTVRFFVWKSERELAGSWELIFADDFQRVDLGADWQIDDGEGFLRDGMLVLDGANVLAKLNHPHESSVKIEYDAMTPVGARVCDLSVFLCGVLEDRPDMRMKAGYFFGFGSNYNERNKVLKDNSLLNTTTEPKVENGRWYHVTATKDGTHLMMDIDGERVLTAMDYFPGGATNELNAFLYTWNSIVHIDNVKLYRKSVAMRASPLDPGIRMYNRGLFDLAADEFERVWRDHNGEKLGWHAYYRYGMASLRAAKYEEALECFVAIQEGGEEAHLSMPARCMRVKALLLQEQYEQAMPVLKECISLSGVAEVSQELNDVLGFALDCLSLQKRFGLSVELTEYVLQSLPQYSEIKHGRIMYELVDDLAWMGKRERAIEAAEAILARDDLGELVLKEVAELKYQLEWVGRWGPEMLEQAKSVSTMSYLNALAGLGMYAEQIAAADEAMKIADSMAQEAILGSKVIALVLAERFDEAEKLVPRLRGSDKIIREATLMIIKGDAAGGIKHLYESADEGAIHRYNLIDVTTAGLILSDQWDEAEKWASEFLADDEIVKTPFEREVLTTLRFLADEISVSELEDHIESSPKGLLIYEYSDRSRSAFVLAEHYLKKGRKKRAREFYRTAAESLPKTLVTKMAQKRLAELD